MKENSLITCFYRNVKKLNGMIAERGIPVIFMANIPASEANERDGADYWRILHMCDINDAYRRLEREVGATVVSLYEAFTAYCENNQLALDSLLCDGLHPNNDGYRAMYGLIIEAFQL